MKAHIIQHIPFEGPGHFETVTRSMNIDISVTKIYETTYLLPSPDDMDMLIITGGPMGVYDTDIYPWLAAEKEFIKKAIDAGIKIIGICLGAQLIAEVLGAAVVKNRYREIGWFPVLPDRDYTGLLSGIFDHSPEVFHWHGDTFGIPEGCMRICGSEACDNQGFDYKRRVFGLQFHLETTPSLAAGLVENCRDDLSAGGEYVQDEQSILADRSKYEKINSLMEEVFSRVINV